MTHPTNEEWQVILSALKICQANSTIAETLQASALDLVQSYMGDGIVVETEWNDGPITIRGFGVPQKLIDEME
jgi:hypothetical protein